MCKCHLGGIPSRSRTRECFVQFTLSPVLNSQICTDKYEERAYKASQKAQIRYGGRFSRAWIRRFIHNEWEFWINFISNLPLGKQEVLPNLDMEARESCLQLRIHFVRGSCSARGYIVLLLQFTLVNKRRWIKWLTFSSQWSTQNRFESGRRTPFGHRLLRSPLPMPLL